MNHLGNRDRSLEGERGMTTEKEKNSNNGSWEQTYATLGSDLKPVMGCDQEGIASGYKLKLV